MNKQKIDRIVKSLKNQGYTDGGINNRLKKEEIKENEEKNQKRVKEIIIDITWNKSKTWNYCPRVSARVKFIDGSYQHDNGLYYTGGCGYDKESTVIARIFNKYLKYKLWEIEDNQDKIRDRPYGISLDYNYGPHYNGGVGVNCYYEISKFIGGKLESITHDKNYDIYKFTMDNLDK